MVRIHGHSSAYTAYECLHQPTYSSVFNITNNYGCGGYCGGSPVKIGGFWNSFAYGFGNGLSNLFGGFGGMFGGMFGGGMGMFPMFNMFGIGNMFGGGMGMFPWLSMFGGGGSKPATASTVTCSCGCSGKTDADNALIEDYESKIKALSGDKDKAQAQTYYNDILKLRKNPKDDVNKTQNQLAYQELLDQLKKKYPDLKTDEVEDEVVDEVDDNDGKDEISDDVKKEWNKVNISTNFPGLTDAMKLKLQKIGVKPVQIGGKWYITLPKDLKAENIKILAESGLPVAVAYNNSAQDKWIAGKISVPSDFSDTNYKWSIDCNGYGSKNNKFNVEKGSADGKYKLTLDKTTVRTAVWTIKNGAEYDFSDGKLSMERDAKVLTSQNKVDKDYEMVEKNV